MQLWLKENQKQGVDIPGTRNDFFLMRGKKMETIKQVFSESELPYLTNIIDWHSVSDEFKEIISSRYEVIQDSR